MVKHIGIVGCGGRVKSIIRLVESVNSGGFVYHIFDINEDAMFSFSNEFGGKKTVIYQTYNDLLNNVDVKWIVVGSVNSAHRDNLISAIKSGKNIFTEKPLAISFGECKEIRDAYENLGLDLKFLVSYPLRYSPHYLKIKEIIDGGKIGRVVSLEFNEVVKFSHGGFIMSDWRRFEKISGGHLLEKCCHDIDLVNWLLKSVPVKVSSFGGLDFFDEKNQPIYDDIKRAGLYSDKVSSFQVNPFTSEKTIVDNQVAIMEYENGVRATFHTNCSSAIPERRMYICGTKGTIRADLEQGKIEIDSIIDPNRREIINSKIRGGHGGGDIFLARDFVDAVFDRNFPSTSIYDAFKSAVSAIAIDLSRKKGEVLVLNSVWKGLNI